MTDAQSRTHRPRIVEHYSDMQVRVSFISCSEASRFCKAIEGGSFTIYPVVQASHPTPRRDEHITRMLDQLSGGVGMFLQEDGVGLSEYVQELEDNSARTQALYDVLNNMCVRTATTYPGKTETFAEAVQWMKENVIDNLVRKQNEINRQVHRACMAENELADLKRHIAERDRRLAAIAAWDMPYAGYGGHWGSNGERDYIRSVARGKPEWLARPKEPKP